MAPLYRLMSTVFVFFNAVSCTSLDKPPSSGRSLPEVLTPHQGEFKGCAKYLIPEGENVSLEFIVTLNEKALLESLQIDQSSLWDRRFYHCVYNVIDQVSFPAPQSEEERVLVFKLPFLKPGASR